MLWAERKLKRNRVGVQSRYGQSKSPSLASTKQQQKRHVRFLRPYLITEKTSQSHTKLTTKKANNLSPR